MYTENWCDLLFGQFYNDEGSKHLEDMEDG